MDALHAEARTRRFTAVLWGLVLGPPIIWAARFMVSYAIAPLACSADALVLLHGMTVVAILATVGLGAISWRCWSAVRAALGEHAGDDVLERARSMALFGMMSGALFTLVIIAEGLANLMIDPCMRSGPLVPH